MTWEEELLKLLREIHAMVAAIHCETVPDRRLK